MYGVGLTLDASKQSPKSPETWEANAGHVKPSEVDKRCNQGCQKDGHCLSVIYSAQKTSRLGQPK